MIVVLGARGGGSAKLANLLRLLGCHVEDSPDPGADEEILDAARDVWGFSDPVELSAMAPKLLDKLTPRKPSTDAQTLAFVGPRLCLTLPFWQRLLPNPTFLVLHRHPIAVAQELRREQGIPTSAGLAMWQLDMLSALHHSTTSPRHLVRYADLCSNPVGVARELHAVLGVHRTSLARVSEIAALAEMPDVWGSDALLTRAQHALAESLEAGSWPTLDSRTPFEHLARDPLILLHRLESHAPGIRRESSRLHQVGEELTRELGRVRAELWHLGMRDKEACLRLEHVETERARLEHELADLREALRHERLLRTRLQASTQPSSEPAPAVRARSDSRQLPPKEARLEQSAAILHRFAKHFYREWTQEEGVPYCAIESAAPLKVMVGTLHSNENEFDQCVQSVRKQGYRIQHEIFSGLGKKESVATLMTAFARSDCDLLVKVDADMVLTAPDFVERVVRIFQTNPRIDLLCVAILDFFSGGPIQGINIYRKTAEWSREHQDSLFTDRSQVPEHKRMIVWPTFVRDALHAPNPSPFQAFHFGVHRGLKTLQPNSREFLEPRAEEQLLYLEKTWTHFQLRRDIRLCLACLGFELALTGRYSLEELDYTNPSLHEAFREFEQMGLDRVEQLVRQMRAERVESEQVNRLRDRREILLARDQAPVRSVLALLPHTKVFGGVNRFFELARHFSRLGVRFVIAQPEPRGALVAAPRTDYADVEVCFYPDVIDEEWDVVLCGDAFGGVMLTMPLFRAKLCAVYLLNGWGRSPLNHVQIELINPDIIIANSSFSAAQYLGCAPAIVPGGVDLETFHPPAARKERSQAFRVCAYPGRRKPSKRFEDTVDACSILHERGVPVELHAFDQGPLHLDVPFPLVFHGSLQKEGVRELFWNVDVMVCAEEDGGWSNPAAEAMACGTPLVCTDAGTIDFALDEETALVVPRRSPQAIADAVERLYRDAPLAVRLSDAGLARIRAFGWPQVARGLLDALQAGRLDRDARVRQDRRALDRIHHLFGTRR